MRKKRRKRSCPRLKMVRTHLPKEKLRVRL
jgi:hypothetical protein